jgi:alginate O-acetyltransferase complex protein AlgI
MVFSSLLFLFLFLPLVLAGYFLLKRTASRNLLLLASSLLFYAWGEVTYVWVMLLSITANYCFAIWLEDHPLFAKRLLSLAVVFNLGLLAIFKYSGFISINLNHLAALLKLHPIGIWDVPLPLGVSFFTFHALSYVIDVYRKQASAQRNPISLALYICFFPQLIAGPIIRYHDICDQLAKRVTSVSTFSEGITRFICGLGKKILIANILAKPVDIVFALPTNELSAGLAWLGIFLYCLQIYFDFSGYSDMAIGLGLMFGFRFLENFDYPYVSRSMRELWSRWHISLTNWFRDYLYIPMGGNRYGNWRTAFNLLTVFFLCGLWHGAAWTYVVYGLYNGLFLVLERVGLGGLLAKTWRPFCHLYVNLVWLFGMVIFRSPSLTFAGTYLLHMFGISSGRAGYYTVPLLLNKEILLVTAVAILASTPIFKNWLAQARRHQSAQLVGKNTQSLRPLAAFASAKMNANLNTWRLDLIPRFAQLTLESLVTMLVVMQLAKGAYQPFIYFRF